MRKFIKVSFFIIIPVLFFSACSSDKEIKESSSKIKFEFGHLPETYNLYYEAFAVSPKEYISLKKFTVDESGQMFELEKEKKIKENTIKSDKNIKEYEKIIICVKNKDDKTKKISNSKILEGDIEKEENETNLEFRAVQLDNISGTFRIETPSDEDKNNEKYGIWFTKEENGKKEKGLKISPTPEGWIYEAWLIQDYNILSMGRFGYGYGQDDFNEYSAKMQGITYPGEDFLLYPPEGFTFPLDVTEGSLRVVITLQPFEGKTEKLSEEPYKFKILEKEIKKGEEPHKNIQMDNVKEEIPNGKVKFM